MVSGPIIIIDDDQEDKELIEDVLNELQIPNRLEWFPNCADAYTFLENDDSQAFVILCDVNLPGMTGIEFKRRVDENEALRRKSIPFVFFSTSADKELVTDVYTHLTIQGYFQKAHSYAETKETVKAILEYWKRCKHPNV